MARKGTRDEGEEKKEEVKMEVEEMNLIPVPKELIETRIEFIDTFLREFGSFLSNNSLAALGAYKKALKDVLKLAGAK